MSHRYSRSARINSESFGRSLDNLSKEWEKLEQIRNDQEIEKFVEISDLKSEKRLLEAEIESLKQQVEEMHSNEVRSKAKAEETKIQAQEELLKVHCEVIKLKFQLGDQNRLVMKLQTELKHLMEDAGDHKLEYKSDQEVLLDKFSLNNVNNISDTSTNTEAFIEAAREGNISALEATLTPRCSRSESLSQLLGKALIATCASGHELCAKLLLKFGADIRIRTETGKTVLHCAVTSRNQNLLKCLLDRIMSKSIVTIDEFELNSSKMKNISVLEAREKLDLINAVDSKGFTALHLAVRNNKTSFMVEQLLLQGVDSGIKTSEGLTAKELSSSNNLTSLWGNRSKTTVSVLNSAQLQFWNKSKEGVLYYKAHFYEQALESFSKACCISVLEEVECNITKLDRARLHYNCSRSALRCRPMRVVLSLENAEAALELAGNKGYSGALSVRSDCHMQLMNFAQAVHDLESLIKYHPTQDVEIKNERKRKLKYARRCHKASHYCILGIHKKATRGEIQKAFRKESMRWHPDKVRKNAARYINYTFTNSPKLDNKKTIIDKSLDNDVNVDDDTAALRATIHFKRINEARQVLVNTSDRVIYDIKIRADKNTKFRYETEISSSSESSDFDTYTFKKEKKARVWPWSIPIAIDTTISMKEYGKDRANVESKSNHINRSSSESKQEILESERKKFREWQRDQEECRRRRAVAFLAKSQKSVDCNKRDSSPEKNFCGRVPSDEDEVYDEDDDDSNAASSNDDDRSDTESEYSMDSSHSSSSAYHDEDETVTEDDENRSTEDEAEDYESFVSTHDQRLEEAMKLLGITAEDRERMLKTQFKDTAADDSTIHKNGEPKESFDDGKESSYASKGSNIAETNTKSHHDKKEISQNGKKLNKKKKVSGFWGKALKKGGGTKWWGTSNATSKKRLVEENHSDKHLSGEDDVSFDFNNTRPIGTEVMQEDIDEVERMLSDLKKNHHRSNPDTIDVDVEAVMSKLDDLQKRQRIQKEYHENLIHRREQVQSELDTEKEILRKMNDAIKEDCEHDDTVNAGKANDSILDDDLTQDELAAILEKASVDAAKLEAEMDEIMGDDLLKRANDIERRMDALLEKSDNESEQNIDDENVKDSSSMKKTYDENMVNEDY